MKLVLTGNEVANIILAHVKRIGFNPTKDVKIRAVNDSYEFHVEIEAPLEKPDGGPYR